MKVLTDKAIKLPDPRRYGPGAAGDPLLELAAAGEIHADDALVAAMRNLLERRATHEIDHLLKLAPTRQSYLRLWEALCAATARPRGMDEEVATHVFALPLVMVSGARSTATVRGVLPDVARLVDVLEKHGALGASRNVGFASALTSLETLEQMPPVTLHDWSAMSTPGHASRALAPEPMLIRSGEEVHLRFMLGAAITPAAAPTVVETAAHIGAWGLPFGRAVGEQIAIAGVDLLVLPRPPSAVLKAAHSGRSAQLQVAFTLFLSNAVRRCRAATGDPTLILSMHAAGESGGELRVSVSSPFDETLLEGYRRPLHPLDDLDEIVHSIRELASDCRLTDVRVIDTVLPEGGGGTPLFFRASDGVVAKH